uniref:Hypothetical conserved protein n=1 Tax=uncultured Bacteroidota bacterium TaxID=152509 RepID=H5SMT4_9BACT|nr:hypothetical conserved protein [uncultured Bacteroidetes bacterium]
MLSLMLWETGCRKKEDKFDPTSFQEAAEDNARVEGEQNFVGDAVDNQGEQMGMRRVAGVDSTYLPPCATTTYDSVQRVLVIDFGSTNCLCRDGVYRRGKIRVAFSGPQWPAPGARALITTDSFFVNDNQHIVEKVLFHEGFNQAGERILRDTVTTHRVITPNGTIQWSAVRTLRQTQGQQTWQRWDDVWFIGSSAQGTSRRGNPFSTQTIDSLKIVGSCIFRVPVKGIWQLNTQNHTVRINYDPYNNEACDRVASVQVDNNPPTNVTIR